MGIIPGLELLLEQRTLQRSQSTQWFSTNQLALITQIAESAGITVSLKENIFVILKEWSQRKQDK